MGQALLNANIQLQSYPAEKLASTPEPHTQPLALCPAEKEKVSGCVGTAVAELGHRDSYRGGGDGGQGQQQSSDEQMTAGQSRRHQ